MDAFTTHTGVGVPLRRSNVDTDQIIPAVYLKRVSRTGFEDGLFAAWRNDPSFVLNRPEYAAGTDRLRLEVDGDLGARLLLEIGPERTDHLVVDLCGQKPCFS